MSRFALSFLFSSLAITSRPRARGTAAVGLGETCVPDVCDSSLDPAAMRCCSNPHVWQCTVESNCAPAATSVAAAAAARRPARSHARRPDTLALPATPLAEAERQISSASRRAAVRYGKDYRDSFELWHAIVLLEPSSAASALFERHALRAAAAFPSIRFLIVQDAQFSSFGALYSVRGFPSVLLFSNGHLMDRFNERAGLVDFIAVATGTKAPSPPRMPRCAYSFHATP